MVFNLHQKVIGSSVMKSNLHDSSDFQISYDFKLAKIESSLKWLLIISSSGSNNFIEQVSSITSGLGLHPTIEHLLLNGEIYICATERIFGFKISSKRSIAEVINVLCKNGSYIIGKNDAVLTVEQLQQRPLDIDSHLRLVDILVMAASTKLWSPVDDVISKVKKIYNYKTLPNNLQDCIFIWVNTVVQKVKYLDESFAAVNSPKINHEDRRHGYYPIVNSSVKELCNSCVLVYLLHYYCPFHIRLENMNLNPNNSASESMCNLRIALRFCYDTLFQQKIPQTVVNQMMVLDHLAAKDFVHAHEEFRAHFLGFYSYLFYILEVSPNAQFVKPRDQPAQSVPPSGQSPRKLNASLKTLQSARSSTRNDLSKTIERVQPQVESLLSEATKRSFNLNNMSAAINNGNLKPKVPPPSVIPERSSEELPNKSKWKVSEPFVPLSTSCSTDSNPSQLSQISSTTTASSTTVANDAAKKFYERPDIKMTNLLSRVNIDPDEETFNSHCESSVNISSEIEDNLDVIDNNLSWDGFVKNSNHTPRPATIAPTDDIKIETYRTDVTNFSSDVSTCPPVNNFMAKPITNTSSSTNTSRSDLTDITVIPLNDGGSRVVFPKQHQNGGQQDGSGNVHSSVNMDVSNSMMRNSIGVDVNNIQAMRQQKPLQNSYTVQSTEFNTADSARAAGYPIITQNSIPFHPQRSLDSEHHHNGNNNNIDNKSIKASQSSPQLPSACKCPTNNTPLRRSKVTTMQSSSPNTTMRGDDSVVVSSSAVRLRKGSAARRRIGKVKSCFDMKSYTKADPAPGTTIREAKILEISQRLDVLRVDLDSLRQNPLSQAGNRIHSTPMNSVPHNIPPPSFNITNASPFPLQSNNITNHHHHLHNTSPNVTNIRHEAMTTDDIDEIQRKFQEVNSAVAGARADERLQNSGDHRRISPRRTTPRDRHSYSPSKSPTYARSPGIERTESDFRRNLFSSPAGDRRRSRDSSIRLSLHGDITSTTLNTSDEQFDGSNTSHLHVENEVESRAGKGFTILEDTNSPAQEIEEKKKKFFQNRLRKEKEQRTQQMKRELDALERKQKAREKEEEAARKKQQKEEKRKRLLKQHKKILEDQEQISLAYKRPGVVPTGGMKRTTKSKSTTNLVNAHSSFKSLASLESESHFSISSSSKHHHHTPRSMISGRSERDLSDLDSVVSAPTSEYTGPKLYKQLQSKSNKALIKNAITFSCLPGKVNETSRRKVLNALDKVELAGHFMILFRDHKLQYRAVYDFDVECEKLHRITGTGPTIITPLMVEDLYKYNSGKRTFSKIPSKTMSMSIDAVTIKNHLWQHPSKR